MEKQTQKIAVIGSGLAGLVIGNILSSQNGNNEKSKLIFEIDVYERAQALGMDAASINVTGKHGEKVRLDVPTRVFFPKYYRMLTKLYDSLGVPYKGSESTMSFAHVNQIQSPTTSIPSTFPSNIHSIESDNIDTKSVAYNNPYFSFTSYTIPFLNSMFSLPDIPSSFDMSSFFSLLKTKIIIVYQYIYLILAAKYALYNHQLLSYKTGQVNPQSPYKNMTIEEYFLKKNYSPLFFRDVFFPLFSLACTCTFETLCEYPAVVILDYVANCFPFGWMSFVTCGLKAVVEKLATPIKKYGNIYLNTTVASVSQISSKKLLVETEDGNIRAYHHVIFATQANQAVKILSSGAGRPEVGWRCNVDEQRMTEEWKKTRVAVLSRFPYKLTSVVCHTDPLFMPSSKTEWKCLNFTKVHPSLSKTPYKGVGYNTNDIAMCTHWANKFQPNLATDLFQTTNPIQKPDPKKILSTTWFDRCHVTLDSMMACDDLNKLQGLGNCWFVGSYAWPGIPLLEGCVQSATAVAHAISCGQSYTKN